MPVYAAGMRLAVVVAIAVVLTGCSSDKPASAPTTSSTSATLNPVPATSASGIGEYAMSLQQTSAAGGVTVDATVSYGSTSSSFDGVIDTASGNTDGVLTRNGVKYNRIVVDGVAYEQKQGAVAWTKAPLGGEGFIGSDTRASFESLYRAQNLKSEQSGGKTRVTATLGGSDALVISGLPASTIAMLREEAKNATANLEMIIDANGYIASFALTMKLSGGTVKTKVALTEYGQVVTVEAPAGA